MLLNVGAQLTSECSTPSFVVQGLPLDRFSIMYGGLLVYKHGDALFSRGTKTWGKKTHIDTEAEG